MSRPKLTTAQTKDQVLKLGIDKYNEACRAIVMRYSREWEATVNRIGRWIDFENDYKTLNLSYAQPQPPPSLCAYLR